MEYPQILVFVEFPDPTFPSTGFLNSLRYLEAELIGFYQVDGDESVDEARGEREAEFTETLDDHADRFEDHAIPTETRLVFGDDPVEARREIAERDDVDAILLPGEANTIGRVLIPTRDRENAETKADAIYLVGRDDLIDVDPVYVADPDDPDDEAAGLEALTDLSSHLTRRGIPETRISRKTRSGNDIGFELSEAARGYDLVVLGRTRRDVSERIFGPIAEYIAEERSVPVLIVT